MVRTPTDLPASLKRSVVAIGNFDGVHLGHARIVERLKARGAELNAPTLIFTFDPHPLSLLRPEASPLPLTWLERKIALLEELGVDGVLVYPTNSTLLSLSAEAFFQQIILDSLQSRGLVEGPNFYFGRGRSGNIEFLRGKCEQLGLAFEVVEPFTKSGELISSSRVRELIQAGRIGAAKQSLTRPYRLRGSVGRGAARGRTIGFPTANLEGVETVVPGPGVYIARAYVEQMAWPAAVNIGPNPTFGEQAGKIEVHLVGFQGDLYDRTLEVEFLDRLRDVQTFASVHELIDQLRRDVAEVCETCACMKS